MKNKFNIGDDVYYGDLKGKVTHIWKDKKQVQAYFEKDQLKFIILSDCDGHTDFSKVNVNFPKLEKQK